LRRVGTPSGLECLAVGRRIRLDQVATVADTVAEPRSVALLNGAPVVGFEVVRALKASEVETASGVRAALEQLRIAHPQVQITEAIDFVEPVQAGFDGSMMLLYEGAVLAVLVVWAFLRSWRATLVAATALPLSVIPAFALMHYVFGFTINVVTLLSLSLVVGILVDDAIVEIENIMRHLRMGKTPLQAAREAADEIGLAVIATTFTLIAVFLPTAFMSGVPGKFFVQFGWTAAIAVFFSLVVARMLTPMMAAYLMKAPRKPEPEPEPLVRVWAATDLVLRPEVQLGAGFGAGVSTGARAGFDGAHARVGSAGGSVSGRVCDSLFDAGLALSRRNGSVAQPLDRSPRP
jgi:multidrug efflux pump subunit AcrB